MATRNNLTLIFFLFFLCFSLNTHLSHGADTISAKPVSLRGPDHSFLWWELRIGFPQTSNLLGWNQPKSGICFGLSQDNNVKFMLFCGEFSTCNQIIPPFCNCLHGFSPKSMADWNLSDYSGGCARKNLFQCENPMASNKDSDRFWEYPNMRLPEHPQSVAVNNDTECKSSCLSTCSCTAYAYDSDGCSVWSGELVNLQQPEGNDGSGSTLYLRLAASEFPSAKSNKGIVISTIVGSVVVLLGLVVIVIWTRQRRSAGPMKPVAVEGSLVAFGYRDLQTATKNFSEKLGGGGFGSVFKGTLPDSTIMAVKKLESINQGEKQFRTEVSTIGTIQHFNLVRLRGFCSEGNKKLRVLTTMRGTRGYLAPEWISGVAITAKADVYSYGMMLFELISGRRNFEQSENGKVKFLPIWAASGVVEGGDLISLLDHRLGENADAEELRRIARVACWCIQDDENNRPTMGLVVQILEGFLEVNPPPLPQSLQLLIDNHEHIVFFTESSSSQSSQTTEQLSFN
ncbi:S-locus lectin protein kinase family protein [Actinidia rufa]|uniref:S-locus lectin protein kinase family protein n=1 Tax=Actinidia rufa TaxID=165716 RepID=A0A7J0GTM5_9ERIC|nr:S-locus lectin protein kinase family protein [Actinidia rufa]